MDSSGTSIEQPAAANGPSEPQGRVDFSRRRKLAVLVFAGLLAAGGAAYWFSTRQSDLERARAAIETNDWPAAREHLNRHLAHHPRDADAHMLMAQAYAKGDAGESNEFVERAIHHLQQIPDDAPIAAKARLQEARLVLLVLRRPGEAERLLNSSLAFDRDSYDANLLMWKLLDLTGRHIHSGEYFWKVYELSPPAERPLRLRDWFFAEFFPDLANAPYSRALDARKVGTIPVSINLIMALRKQEPQAAFLHAALAEYYRETGKPRGAVDILKQAPDLSRAMNDAFFVAVLFESLIDLGEFQKAKTCFNQWPKPRSGYLFLRCQGKYRQYVLKDAAAAVESYRQALAFWPAKFDWSLMMRLSESLRTAGRADAAERIRAKVDELTTKVLTQDSTTRLRVGLANLRDVAIVREVRDLYRKFGLQREADAWQAHLRQLSDPGKVDIR